MTKSSSQFKISAAACALAMAVFAVNSPSIGGDAGAATAPVSPIAGIEAPSLPALPAILPR